MEAIRKNRTLYITLAGLLLLFVMATQGMETQDWVITLLRSLAVGSVTFLVASGFSIIFGLMDVLNLAHGTLFMVGAYVGWTVVVRPDTFVDGSTPFGITIAGLALIPVLARWLKGRAIPASAARVWPWISLVMGGGLLFYAANAYPITSWNPGVYAESPITYAFSASQDNLLIPNPELFNHSPTLVLVGLIAGSLVLALGFAGLNANRQAGLDQNNPLPKSNLYAALGFFAFGLIGYLFNGTLTDLLVNAGTNWRFLLGMLVAIGTGFGLGAFMEFALIRPLYSRPIYQILMTLGLSVMGLEIVRATWGQPEFTMPKPAIFNGTGAGCPATTLQDLVQFQCSTIHFLGGRIRTYNEIFVPLVGIVILVAVWILLQRTRLGMIIRAGVQDGEMVEALGINVRQVFTLVFALGVALASLGGIIAAPMMGVSLRMGESLLINALIALAIGGLTSYPGAAIGSLLVGLMQQFIIKYGQIGIHLPFIAEPFKPTPPLVPASTVLLMVIVLLILPQGLLGRKE